MDLKIVFLLFLSTSFAYSSFETLSTNSAGTVLSFFDHRKIQYLVGKQTLLSINTISPEIPKHSDLQLSPATSIWITEKSVSTEYLRSQLDLFSRLDDVWNENFLENLFLF